MKHDPHKHHRRSIRLKSYDYSQNGAYFVTICTQDKQCLFGDIDDGAMHLNDAGNIIESVWKTLPDRFPHIELDTHVTMPNHFHGIIIIKSVGAPFVGAHMENFISQSGRAQGTAPTTSGRAQGTAPTTTGHTSSQWRAQGTAPTTSGHAPTLGDVVGAFKSVTTLEYIQGVKSGVYEPFRKRLWQRNYYERIIRNDRELDETRAYILYNPDKWHDDDLYTST